METIRIRLTKEQKAKLQGIAERDYRSITGVIRHWIDGDNKDARAAQLFGAGSGGNTVPANKEYLR